MLRYILRPPSYGSTPKRLRKYLRAQSVVKVTPREQISVDWNQDFFMAYPPVEMVNNAPDEYREMRALYVSNKLRQRQWLANQGFSVPRTYTRLHQPFGEDIASGGSREFVVRPLRHTQGEDYRITNNDSDFDPESEYLSQVFPKRWEYRVILVKGKPLFTLLKKFIRDPLHFNQPWNHANGAYFVTCHSYTSNRLRWTNIYDLCQQSQVLQQFHIVALDVLLGDRRELGLARTPYAICEMNFCPSLTIQHNLEAVRTHVLHSS
jgi:hypothetical protein